MRAQVYMSWGLWVARCPRPGCLGAEHYGPHPKSKYVGGLTLKEFNCEECGLSCPADWPEDWAKIEKVLSRRPLVMNRNYLPDESMSDLLEQNIALGVTDTEAA